MQHIKKNVLVCLKCNNFIVHKLISLDGGAMSSLFPTLDGHTNVLQLRVRSFFDLHLLHGEDTVDKGLDGFGYVAAA
jgi:hypothetical protein